MPQEFLASSVASRLGARIVDGDLQAGDVLRLEDIEQESGASRSVCREAVKILESLNLVRSRRHVGVTVLPPPSVGRAVSQSGALAHVWQQT
ncbi:GntR-family transcriptional regulator [Cutibacterium avidum ATCC 25577]|uniref:GntR-family transcriptional regulator n=1 Tax=Cutibacterium avidum ATCC 25577 TaxID=997355 RepID=G4D0F0_9ACTN|nr:GntR-family transcriptional regulator [Cutibacterium avidum ATCC 25577]